VERLVSSARESSLSSQFAKVADACGEGCFFSSSGGISCRLMEFRTSAHLAAVVGSPNCEDRVSRRSLPFCFSGPWQETQFPSGMALPF